MATSQGKPGNYRLSEPGEAGGQFTPTALRPWAMTPVPF